MVRQAKVVIGANYGDEGKGAMVDRFTTGPETLVVRFNGGAQAGHTVTTPDGRRHIFQHIGSGAFMDARTFLSRFFVADPMSLEPEMNDLRKLGVYAKVFVDRRALMTTPYDILINQVVEMARGSARHGSCGHGFGETIERAEKGYGTTVGDVEDFVRLREKLVEIRDVWTPARLARLGVTTIPDDYQAFFSEDVMIDAYLEAVRGFAAAVTITSDALLRDAADIVFEGAQGLLLDQDRGDFPYVTRSNTGLRNVLALAKETGIEALEVTYATRSYLTRHGAGPLDRELPAAPFPNIVDETNIQGPWQGSLRFAHLDVDSLVERLKIDLGDAIGSGVTVEARLALTCLDQAPDVVPIVLDGELRAVPRGGLVELILNRLGWSEGFEGWGAKRDAWRPVEGN